MSKEESLRAVLKSCQKKPEQGSQNVGILCFFLIFYLVFYLVFLSSFLFSIFCIRKFMFRCRKPSESLDHILILSPDILKHQNATTRIWQYGKKISEIVPTQQVQKVKMPSNAIQVEHVCNPFSNCCFHIDQATPIMIYR